MTGCGKYGALSSIYVEKLSTDLLSSLYTENNMTTQLNALPFWWNFQNPSDTINILAVKRIEIL